MFGYFLYRNAWRFDNAPHKEEELSVDIVSKLLRTKGWLLRNTFDFDQKDESEFWYVIKDSFGGLNELSSSMRVHVRKALKNYEYKVVGEFFLMDNAYHIYEKSMNGYKIKDRSISKNEFYKIFRAECECWGCFSKTDGRLVGFAVNYLWSDCCQYEYTAIIPECKKDNTYPYYGLFYSMNQYYLGEKKLKYVCDGSRSITEHSNIQQFLMYNFKFRKAYCKLNVYYKWWFRVVVKLLFPFRNLIPFRNVKAILRMEEYSRKSK